MKQKFLDAIKDNDVVLVRICLSNELLVDPRGQSFDEMLKLAESQMKNLYEDSYSNFGLESDRTLWNKKYLSNLKNELDTHFTKQLLSHYRDVVLVVLKEKADSMKAQAYTHVQNNEPLSHSETFKKVASGVFLLGGVGLAATGLYLSKSIMVKTGAFCLLAGGYFSYNLLKEKGYFNHK